ncbi:MAG: hypothetical protein ABIO46_12700 [Chitinophagales bacterium]
MEFTTEDIFLMECRSQIEVRLSWGTTDLWTNHDFELLSDEIQKVTGTVLSVTTLKRIWGKVKYESKPAVVTLNTLAQFIGFENWRDFIQHQPSLNGNGHLYPGRILTGSNPAEEGNAETFPYAKFHSPDKHQASGSIAKLTRLFSVNKKRVLFSIVIFLLLISITVLYFSNSGERATIVNPSEFSFSSKKIVASGIPNSVVFDYDASAAAESDSIAIQQSWDPNLSQMVSSKDRQHTSIYYYPGFFEAKLLVNKTVIKEHPLLISTNGWLPLVEEQPVPVYFTEADISQNGFMQLPVEKLSAGGILLQPEAPWTDYFNVREFNDLKADNFIFETELRNDYAFGTAVCRHTEIMLLTEGSAIIIPLSVKGCTSDLKLYFADHQEDGKKQDLSALGCDIANWVKVRCEVKNKTGNIFINNQLAFTTNFESPATKITGIVYRFRGSGSVRSVMLSNIEGIISYQENF